MTILIHIPILIPIQTKITIEILLPKKPRLNLYMLTSLKKIMKFKDNNKLNISTATNIANIKEVIVIKISNIVMVIKGKVKTENKLIRDMDTVMVMDMVTKITTIKTIKIPTSLITIIAINMEIIKRNGKSMKISNKDTKKKRMALKIRKLLIMKASLL